MRRCRAFFFSLSLPAAAPIRGTERHPGVISGFRSSRSASAECRNAGPAQPATTTVHHAPGTDTARIRMARSAPTGGMNQPENLQSVVTLLLAPVGRRPRTPARQLGTNAGHTQSCHGRVEDDRGGASPGALTEPLTPLDLPRIVRQRRVIWMVKPPTEPGTRPPRPRIRQRHRLGQSDGTNRHNASGGTSGSGDGGASRCGLQPVNAAQPTAMRTRTPRRPPGRPNGNRARLPGLPPTEGRRLTTVQPMRACRYSRPGPVRQVPEMVAGAGTEGLFLAGRGPRGSVHLIRSSGSDVVPQRDLFEGMVRATNDQFRIRRDPNRPFTLEVDRWEQDAPRRTTEMNEEFVRRACQSHATVVLLSTEVRPGTRAEIEGVLNESDVQLSVIWMEQPDSRRRAAALKKFFRENQDIAYHRTGPPESADAVLAMVRVIAASLADITHGARQRELFSESR